MLRIEIILGDMTVIEVIITEMILVVSSYEQNLHRCLNSCHRAKQLFYLDQVYKVLKGAFFRLDLDLISVALYHYGGGSHLLRIPLTKPFTTLLKRCQDLWHKKEFHISFLCFLSLTVS